MLDEVRMLRVAAYDISEKDECHSDSILAEASSEAKATNANTSDRCQESNMEIPPKNFGHKADQTADITSPNAGHHCKRRRRRCDQK